jgi:hypothetical protein
MVTSMAALRRFSPYDIATLKAMAEHGHDGKSIALALGRTAQSVRVKAVELGIALRPPSLDARRIKLGFGTWAVLEGEARRFNMRPSKLARLIVETVIADDLIDAVLDDLPRSWRQPAVPQKDRKWQIALGSRSFTNGANAVKRLRQAL